MSNILRLKGGQLVKSVLRLQSPSRGCPRCGRVDPSPNTISDNVARHYSISSFPSLMISAEVKKPKRKKKGTKTLTEIIQVNKDSIVSESTTSLSKLKPKEVQKCIENITKSSNISIPLIKRPFDHLRPSQSLFLTSQNYATIAPPSQCDVDSQQIQSQRFIQDQLFNNETSEETIFHECVNSNTIEADLEDGQVFLNPNLPSYQIPTENDLIDKEIDYETIPKPRNIQSDPKTSMKKGNYMTNKKFDDAKERKLKKEEREHTMKVRTEEMVRMAKETSLNKSLVSYLEMCVYTGQIYRGFNTLNYYRARSKAYSQHPKVQDIAAYNILLHGFAAKGLTSKVREIFQMILNDNLRVTPQSYASLFESLGRNLVSKNNVHSIRQSIKYLENDGFTLQDLFNKVTFEGDQREVIQEAIRRANPSFQPVIVPPDMGYACSLLNHLNDSSVEEHSVVSQAGGLISLGKLEVMAKKQLELERKGTVTVKSIEKKDNLENLAHYRLMAQETEKSWGLAIEEALERNMNTLFNQGMKHKSQRAISLYPFLKVLSPKDYTRIIIQEIRKLAEGSETYSPGVAQLYRELGSQVLARYQVLYKDKKGVLQKVEELYSDYLKWSLDPPQTDNETPRNPRQKWQQLLYAPNSTGPHVDIVEKEWPNSVLSSVGRFLYGIIMRDIKINANVMKMNSKTEQIVPAFYSIFRMQGMHLKEEIKPHPALVKLFQAASRDELTFDTTLVPMLCPPLPWASIRTGGYLLSPAKIVRLPYQAHQQKLRLENCPPQHLYPSLDSLNQLGAVPWRINHKVLDTVIQVFNNKGDDRLNVPPPTSECPTAPSIDPSMSRQEKYKIHKERASLKRLKGEMYSLWCDALYRLSLANHFRDDIFWLPHNMDFRGRVYPCPPHLNHLGADVARAILMFAKGQPLGDQGLDWLKLHLVNLTGLKKRDSIEERLAYANKAIHNILDSADFPLTGERWWAESEEPWQTLACCMEIANAIRSEDPTTFVSHYPIHQDGSCNGLQHYAALGRDQAGAESVNLAPSHIPQDVYSLVAKLVEKLRADDAANGVKIAQVLDGFIRRKVIKQTVMTTVYGVTRYGARLQIAKQLKDIPDFPKEHLWPASLYLVGRTFDSLQEMFTSTKLIQDWFTECARQISQVCGQNVEWVTPLGLPVVQPYFRASKKSAADYSDPSRIPEQHVFDMYERPNVMKQKNAFPPNFIHSLDSSHMMLTSLHCERKGITYVSVHDCYWTHPATVQVMNQVCREQFVALHSQPILEDLSRFLVQKYSYRESDFSKVGSVVDASKHQLNSILQDVPSKGFFDLNKVLRSVFFFS